MPFQISLLLSKIQLLKYHLCILNNLLTNAKSTKKTININPDVQQIFQQGLSPNNNNSDKFLRI